MKYLSVPVDIPAMERLVYDKCSDDDLVEVVLNEHDYKKLWDTGVLDIINEKLNKNIDDYEDEVISGLDELNLAQAIINKSIDSSSSADILIVFSSQIDLAIKFNTGLFIYF